MTLKCRPDKSVKVSLTTCVSPKIILCHTMVLNERVSEAYNADSGHLELNQQNYAIAVSYIFEYPRTHSNGQPPVIRASPI